MPLVSGGPLLFEETLFSEHGPGRAGLAARQQIAGHASTAVPSPSGDRTHRAGEGVLEAEWTLPAATMLVGSPVKVLKVQR